MIGKYQINNQSEKRVEYEKVDKARRNLSLFVDANCRELQKVSENIITISNYLKFITHFTLLKKKYNSHEYIIAIAKVIFIQKILQVKTIPPKIYGGIFCKPVDQC